MHLRPVFAFKPDFKPHSRSFLFLHHFLCFKSWLTSNWSQELIYNVYSINRMLQYRVWLTQFLTRFASSWSHQFKAYEIQPSSQTISCYHGEGVWSVNLINYGLDCSILFLERKFSLEFSSEPLKYFASSLSHCVLLSMLFSTVYNMWVFVAIFRFWAVEQAGGTVASYCSNENFRIWPLSILILNLSRPFADFLISLLLLNCFSKIILSKLHQNLLKFFLKYNKFMVIFIYHFTLWSSIN
jgi:hypothetical protein